LEFVWDGKIRRFATPGTRYALALGFPDHPQPASESKGRAKVSTTATKQTPMHVGVALTEEGVIFRTWAPERTAVDVVLVGSDGREQRKIRLKKDSAGYFSRRIDEVTAGDLYFYQVDDDPKLYPDPASHFQPQGVHGPSQVVDHSRFPWTDDNWPGPKLLGQVIYELHIGSFTPEGTWAAATEKLPHLYELGVSLIELMPVAAFPGNFGWGYDGAYWYAPTHLYGSPDDFKNFVNEAHRLKLGVLLDVVYNHFGPCGNYTAAFSPYFVSKNHSTEWGDAINFDGEQADPVRDFVAENAAYWVREFHLDGLRLDATQSIHDESDDHIVAKLTRIARAAAGNRSILIFAEDENQLSRQARSPEKGGFGIDGLWNDDFHHACRVAATGNMEAYYSDYLGSPQELISAIRLGYLYQGQWHARQKRYRGTPSWDLPAPKLVHFLQNHDQVANSARSVRTHLLTTPGRQRALTALLLLGPQTPLLFMGQEFAASSPFYYFADHESELAELVRKGRDQFLSQFRRIHAYHAGRRVPDPADPNTFAAAKLDWSECERNSHELLLHRDLIDLRRNDPVFSRQDKTAIEGAVIGPEAFLLRWFDREGDDRLAVFNLGRDLDFSGIAEPHTAAPPNRQWDVLWSSEEPDYGGTGTPAFSDKCWHLPGHSAVIFRAKPT
jgi:maltooligosyltrehalose trehalohydrolase